MAKGIAFLIFNLHNEMKCTVKLLKQETLVNQNSLET